MTAATRVAAPDLVRLVVVVAEAALLGASRSGRRRARGAKLHPKSARCKLHPKAIVSCSRFARAAVVVELVQAIGEI